MEGRGCFACLSFLVISLNTVVLLAGLSLTVLAGWLVAQEHLYLGTADLQSLSTPALVLLASGLAVVTLGALGCCGALATSRCLLGTFSLLLLSLTFAQLSAGLLVYYKKLDYGVVVEHMARETVQEKYQTNNTATVLYWDHVQAGLQCCGSSGPGDWSTSSYSSGHSGQAREIGIGAGKEELPFLIPPSCCRNPGSHNCSAPVRGQEAMGGSFYTQGCSSSLKAVLGDHFIYILCAGAGLLLLEVLGVCLSLCLCCTLARIEARKA